MIYAVNKRTKEHRVYRQPMEPDFWAECELVIADADGWIEWDMDVGQPVNSGTRIDVKCQNGEVFFNQIHAAWCADGGLRITHYRPILDQPASEEPNEWCGEGLPPLGTVCNIGCFIDGTWVKQDFDYRIDYIGKSVVVASTVGTIREVERVFKEQLKFYPIRTDRERWIEAAKQAVIDADFTADTYEAIYDAGLAKLPEQIK